MSSSHVEPETGDAPVVAASVIEPEEVLSLEDRERLDLVAKQVALGRSLQEASETTGIAIEEIERLVSLRGFVERVRAFVPTHADVQARFAALVPRAQDRLAHLLDHATSEKVQTTAAKLLLDYGGHAPTRRIATLSLSIDAPLAALLDRVAAESGVDLKKLVEETLVPS